ncbi:acyl-CoA dehydrogenase family protein [Acidovorax sp. NCPPB 2350]|nr:acyl-CoA dehydrogenase family protein [Acidovorax sp. NCPPB 2350]
MDIGTHSAPPEDLVHRTRHWVDTHLIPAETALGEGDDAAHTRMAGLTASARQSGLWGIFLPLALGGQLGQLGAYARVAEEEGRSEFGPEVFGSEAVVDAHMLHRHGTRAVREHYLADLAAGRATPAYGMSEPDGVGSVPATIQTTATLEDGHWRIEGRKWFICRARRAAFVTVVARTRAHGPADGALSMIVVPADAPGFQVERSLDILGRDQGQCEISFHGVRVPADHVLGAPHQGMALMRQRLAMGRLVRSSHWLGLGQRCLDLMGARIHSPRGRLAGLADKQLVRQHVFEAHLALKSARALLRMAAAEFDAGQACDVSVNLAKVATARALGLAADSAVQIHGAEGLSALTPLSHIYRAARATRILDGTDEALINAVGRDLIAAGAPIA